MKRYLLPVAILFLAIRSFGQNDSPISNPPVSHTGIVSDTLRNVSDKQGADVTGYSIVDSLVKLRAIYVDNKTGVDSPGHGTFTQPYATLAYAIPKLSSYGALGIAGGYYHEAINLSAAPPNAFHLKGVTIFGYNGTPVISGFDTAGNTGWVLVPGKAHTYKRLWTHEVWTNGVIQMLINNEFPKRVDSLYKVDIVPNSFYVDGTTNTNTNKVYAFFQNNPNSSADIVMISRRAHTVSGGDSTKVYNLEAMGGLNENGNFFLGDESELNNIIAMYGAKHNSYQSSGRITDARYYYIDSTTTAGMTPHVFYNTDYDKLHGEMSAVRVINNNFSQKINGTYVICHGPGGGIGHKLTINGGFTYRVAKLYTGDMDSVVVNGGTWTKLVKIMEPRATKSVVVRSAQFEFTNEDVQTRLSLSPYTLFENCTWYIEPGNNTDNVARIFSADTQRILGSLCMDNLYLQNCTIACNDRTIFRATDSCHLSAYHTIFALKTASCFSIDMGGTAGQTYAGDNNIFFSFNCRIGGTTCTNLALWYSLTGQDGNSVFVPDIFQKSFWIQDPSTGDMTVNPEARVVDRLGHIFIGHFPDGTPITSCGSQTVAGNRYPIVRDREDNIIEDWITGP